MTYAAALLLVPVLALGQADWSRIYPHKVGYDSGYFSPGGSTNMARHGSDLILSGKYWDDHFHTVSSCINHYTRLRVTEAETTLTLIKKSWWHNITPNNGETTRDTTLNLTDPTPPNRHAIFTVAGDYLYQVGGQNPYFDPRRTFQASGVNVTTDEITLSGSGSPVTPYTHLDEVTLATTGTLPGGLSTGTSYFILRVSGTAIKLASSLSNARAGISIDLTSQGTGVDSLLREPYYPSDLWKMNLDSTAGDYATWTQLFAPAATTYLMGAFNGLSLVWDPYRDKILASNLTPYSYGSRRTWSLDIPTTTWTEGSQSAGMGTAPENQSGQQLTFDTRDSTAWLFGAGEYDVGGNELWHYQPSSGLWTKLTPVSPRPAVRTDHCVAYVRGETSADDVLFVSGGVSDGVAQRDSWVYHIQSNTWDSLEVSTLPKGGRGTCQWEPTSSRIVLQVDTTYWLYPIGNSTPAPVVEITSPADEYLTNQGSITVGWEVDGVPQSTGTTEVLALEGENAVIRCSGGVCDTITVIRDQTPPVVVLTEPDNGDTICAATVEVEHTVDGTPQEEFTENLQPGFDTLRVQATDAAGNTGRDSVIVFRRMPPKVEILSPADSSYATTFFVNLVWKVDGVTQTTGNFVSLSQGLNTIIRTATNSCGLVGADTVRVFWDNIPPVLALISPEQGTLILEDSAEIRWSADGVEQTPIKHAMDTSMANFVLLHKTDAAGNKDSLMVTLYSGTRAPNVIGLNLDQADSLVRESALRPWPAWVDNDSIPTGEVFAQSPAENDSIQYRHPVRYSVSRGPDAMDLTPKTFLADSMTVNPLTLAANGHVQVVLVNQGRGTVSDSFNVLVFEDRNRDKRFVAEDDLLLGQFRNGDSIPAGDTLAMEIGVAGTLTFNGNRLTVVLDPEDAIEEVDEGNNVSNSMAHCRKLPDSMDYTPRLKWAWKDSTNTVSGGVQATPVVAQINDDNGDGKINAEDFPDIVVAVDPGYANERSLLALDGRTGHEIWNLDRWMNPSTPAVGDIDGDGSPEIVLIEARNFYNERRLLVLDNQGNEKAAGEWRNFGSVGFGNREAITLNDLDGDGKSEIIWGQNVHDYACHLLYPSKFNFVYRSFVAVDLDKDGYQELIGDIALPGQIDLKLRTVSFRRKKFVQTTADFTLTNIWEPKLASISDRTIPRILHSRFPTLSGYVGKVDIIGTDLVRKGSIPPIALTIPRHTNVQLNSETADFVFGTDSATYYYKLGSVQAKDDTAGFIWWKPAFARTNLRDSTVNYAVLTQVKHSLALGTIFDFNDDGDPEVLLQSLDSLFILSGSGSVLGRLAIRGHQYFYDAPIVADVDRDGSADLVTTRVNKEFSAQPTVMVYSNPTWVGARPMYPNREYTVTNIEDDNSIPRFPTPHWEANNTVNVPCASGHYACVDVSASFPQLVVSGGDTLIRARIGNGGAAETPQGVLVTLYASLGGPDSVLATVPLPRLAPGAYTNVQAEIPAHWRGLATFTVVADDSGNGHGNLDESNEANNSVAVSMLIRNRVPTLETPENQYAVPEAEFTYPMAAADPDGDALTYSLTQSPSGMTIDGSGVLHWTPGMNPPRCTVTVKASDAYDGEASATFLVYVDDGSNQPPVISSTPPVTAVLNTISMTTLSKYAYAIEAEDPEDEGLEYHLDCANCDGKTPPILAGDTVIWLPFQPQWTDADSAVLSLKVTDARGGITYQAWTVHLVRTGNEPPGFASTPDTTALEDQPWRSPVTVFDLDADAVTLLLDTIPLGMAFANDSLRWTPPNPGVFVVRIGATDGYDTTWQRFEVAVAPVNDAPRIVTVAPSATIPGALYKYPAVATDEDGDAVVYRLEQAPSGMTVTSEGVVEWRPSQAQTASVTVELVASDPSNAEDHQTWTLSMVPDTIPPTAHITFSKNPAKPGSPVTVSVGVGDNVEVSSVALTLDGTPVTLTGDSYVFTPTGVGNRIFEAVATDPSSNVGTASGSLRVSNAADLTPPAVSLTFSPEEPEAGETITFTVTAEDTDGVDDSRLWVEVDGVSIRVEDGQAEYQALRPGTLTAKAVAFDSLGASAMAQVAFSVSPQGAYAIVPVVEIDSPSEDTVLYGRVPLIGTASDAHLAYYTLSHRDLNTSAWVEFARRTSGVEGDTLGYIDATSLPNGDYEIRLLAYDRSGNHAARSVQVTVAGEKKIGNFTLAFEDLSIPMSGMSLAVTRTYDSRDKNGGDFGTGWKMGMRSISLHENRNQGQAWAFHRSPGLIPQYSIGESAVHSVTVSLPGGRKQEFTPKPRFFSAFNPTYGVMEYEAKPGTYSRLEAIEVDTFVVMGGELYDEHGDFEEPFNPQRYRITLLDGSYFTYDQTLGGVVESGDANGNTLEWEANVIRHNAGNSISFTRDSLNRITSISDAAGRGMQYRYDVAGNLNEVLDANGNSTRFRYGPDHYLEEVIDARGVRAARTEYDEENRMVRQINAAGDTLKLTHDLGDNTEIIEDFAGHTTTFTYDERGSVLTKTDDADKTWTYAYDSVGNLLSTTYPGGAVRSSTYDDNGNELTLTDELENTTTRTYDAGGRVLTSEDPLGRVTEYEYDSRGNLVKEIGPDEVVQSERTYDSRGNLLMEENALGYVTSHTYDGNGWLLTTTDPLGRVLRYGHDGAGNVTVEVNAAGDTTRHAYDDNGNRVRTVNALGDTLRIEYNAINKVVREIDAMGNATRFAYNALGDRVADTAADGAVTLRTYDGNGNLAAMTDPVGRTTEFEYDHEKRLTKTTFNDESFTETEYDALGRRTRSVDANGNETEFEYDVVGRNTLIRDALGHETHFEYDAAGRKTAMVDALNQRTEYEYDDYDRLVLTRFEDETTKLIGYDLAGRKMSETDQEGHETGFEYDSTGNLVAVIDALDHRTEYTYDANNNRISQKDANNHTTTLAYDALNRMVSRTYPGGNQERWTYDAQGNMLSHVKGSDSTAYQVDAMNREIHREYFPSGHTVTTTYTPDGKRDSVADHRGLTRFAYDSRGRLSAEAMPNGDFLEHDYDPQGNRLRVVTPFDTIEYRYDALNRMDSVVARSGVTRYLYNPIGNRDSVLYSNGTSTGYSYDSLNRLTEVRNWSPADTLLSRFTYTLNEAGIRRAVEELDGSEVTYGYDDLFRLTSETRTGAYPFVTTFSYDEVGNRLTQTKDGVTTTYTYNSRDQLTGESSSAGSVSYTYDPAGRQTSKTDNFGTTVYLWVDEDRLDSISGPGVAVGYTYDADGRKVKETTPDTVRQFLVDRLLPYGQVILETDGAGNMVTEYTYGQERIIQERGGVTHWYLADGQGSVRQLADSNGFVSDTYAYTAFGEPLASAGSTANEFRYVGEEADPNSGFYYLRARWMEPGTGRFIGVDPYEGDPQAPASLHRYLYANASPVSFIDPTGQSLIDVMTTLTVVGVLVNIGAATYDSFKYLTAVDPVEKNVHLALLVVDLAGLAEGPGGALSGGARVVAFTSEFAIVISATNSIRGLAGLITNDGFQQWANDIVSYMEGSGDGSNLPGGTKEKVSEILKRKKGSIKGAPLEKGSPSWNEILDLTLEDIIKKAKAREVGFHKFLKLLKDGRFNK